MNSETDIPNQIRRPEIKKRAGFLIVIVLVAVAATYLLRTYLGFEALVKHESYLKSVYAKQPTLVLTLAFLLYTAATGLSLPIATLLSLIYAWFFGFTTGVLLISFGSTAGATIAFLISRYVLRDIVQEKFGQRLRAFNKALDEEGAFYLFTLRLIPVVPFFVVNAVMGLTRMKVATFWWVSQVGMILGTTVYVYAGSRIPDLATLQERGREAVFSPSQLTQIAFAFALIGITPLVVKRLLKARLDRREKATRP